MPPPVLGCVVNSLIRGSPRSRACRNFGDRTDSYRRGHRRSTIVHAWIASRILCAPERLEVELEVTNRERVWDRLAHWEVELVIAGRAPAVPGFRTLALRKNELVVVAPGESRLKASGLGTATWLLREPGSGTRALTEELFTLLQIAPPQLTIGSNGAIRECVRAGLGISLLSLEAVAAPIAEGQFTIVPTPATPLLRNWQLVTKADRSMTPGAHRFVAYALAGGAFVAPALS